MFVCVQGTHVQQARHVGGAASADDFPREGDMGPFEATAIAACFIQDADQMDDDVLFGESHPQQCGTVRVAPDNFYAGQYGQVGGQTHATSDDAHGMPVADKGGAKRLADETGATDQANGKTFHAS